MVNNLNGLGKEKIVQVLLYYLTKFSFPSSSANELDSSFGIVSFVTNDFPLYCHVGNECIFQIVLRVIVKYQ